MNTKNLVPDRVYLYQNPRTIAEPEEIVFRSYENDIYYFKWKKGGSKTVLSEDEVETLITEKK